MNRISRSHAFMQTAEVWAMRSTCGRGNVGAVVTKGKAIVSIGYNGPPSGHDHCHGNDCPISESGGCKRSSHAEFNAIVQAKNVLRNRALYDCDLYCTYSPCFDCATLALGSSIRRFFYRYSYRAPEGLDLLKHAPTVMGVYRIIPSGQIICARTNEFVNPVEL